MISSTLSSAIGGLNTFFEIIVSALIGVLIIKNFKFSFTESISKARTGQITQEEFLKTNVAKVLGAVLLIIPGFFTDILGIVMQVPLFVGLISKVFTFAEPSNKQSYSTKFSSHDFGYSRTNYTNTGKKTNNTHYKREKNEIIDVEIIDDNSTLKH